MNPDDNPQDDKQYHKNVRKQTEQLIHTPHCREFTREKLGQMIQGLKQKKAPEPNGIINETVKLIFKAIPKKITSLYNECLRNGHFPLSWKIAKVILFPKPGKEAVRDPSKHSPISQV